MTKETKQSSGQITFEDAYHRLEEIARRLEHSSTPLEESIELFQEAQKLLKFSQDLLDRSEKKIKVIVDDGNILEIKEEKID